MHDLWRALRLVVIPFLLAAPLARADLILETRDLRLTIGPDGMCRGLLAKAANAEYGWTAEPGPAFSVVRAGKTFPASSAASDGDVLRVEFAQAKTAVRLRITRTDGYIALKLAAVEGQPVDAVNLLQLRVKPLPYLGPWIDVAYDDAFGLCLCGANPRTNATLAAPAKNRKYVTMTATAYAETGLQDAAAVLLACPEPKNRFLPAMAVVERDFNLPRGAEHRLSPIQRYSYLWPDPTPKDIDEYVRWAKRGGFRMILFSYTAFTKGAGHLDWNAKYPNGMADLKKVTDAIRNAGLAVGLHLHYNKAHKSDPYVTPVPDDRLHKARRFALASPIDEKADVISVTENPKGCTLDKDRRLLKLGRELITYEQFTTDLPYRFTGCRRGALKTIPAAHDAGAELALLDVDEWPIFIRFDQNTDIQDETARRIADIVKQTGPYDMIYFDGAEDVHSPFWYHCANAQYRVYRLLDPEPVVCEAAANTHFGWHMISRSNAYDSVAPPEMKDFCRKHPCTFAPQRALDFTRIEFGWLHGFGKSRQSYITPDTLEYVLSRGAAWDCPFSMTVSLQQLKNNPRTETCFELIRIWEDARINQKLSDAQREQLRKLDQEHHLFLNEKGDYELVPIKPVSSAAGAETLQVWTFRRSGDAKHTYALLWAAGDDVNLTLPISSERISAMRPFGKPLTLEAEAGKTTVRVGERMYLVLSDADVPDVDEFLRKATRQLQK